MKLKKVLSLCLGVILSLSMLPMPAGAATSQPTTFYDAEKAIQYASKHWDDGAGLCGSYISRCLASAGVKIPDDSNFYSANQQSYGNVSGKLGAYTNPATCSAAMLLYLSQQGYQVIKDPKESDMAPGDVLFMWGGKYPDGHVTLINRTDPSGAAYFTAHNYARWDRRVYDLGTFLVKMNGFKDITRDFSNKKIQIVNGNRYLQTAPFRADVNMIYANHPLYRCGTSTFETYVTSDGWLGMKSITSGKFLTVERDSGGELTARADLLEAWQCIRIYRNSEGVFLLRSQATGKFLAVQGDTVKATASAVTPTTQFRLKVVP